MSVSVAVSGVVPGDVSGVSAFGKTALPPSHSISLLLSFSSSTCSSVGKASR